MEKTTRRRYVIAAEGLFTSYLAKTAHGVLRYGRDETVAVIDSEFAGRRVCDVIPSIGNRAPVVGSFAESIRFDPTSLLIGVATVGGTLPPHYRETVRQALDEGLEIVNGLHALLRDDEEFVAQARRTGARLWDVRVPQEDIGVFCGAAYGLPQIVVLAVGSDCGVGKMTAMLELERAAQRAGVSAEFVATGQTGVLIAGRGIAVDHVLSDFVAGAAERLVSDVAHDTAITLVEGQGSIFHPAYAPVTFGLMTGCAPDLLLFCHEVGRATIKGFDQEIGDLRGLVQAHEDYLGRIKPAPCVGIMLNTASLSEASALDAIAAAEGETGLPADDPVRFSGEKMWSAVSAALPALSKTLRQNLPYHVPVRSE